MRQIRASYRVVPVLLSACLVSASCDDFVTLSPISNPSVDDVYRTDDDFTQAVIGGYGAIQQQYQDFWVYGDIRADDSWAEVVKDNVAYWSDAFVMAGHHGNLNTTWSNYYTAIYRVNTVLEQLADADVANGARHEGESRFLRALAYFDLVRMFGDVPIVTQTQTLEEAYVTPRGPVDQVYQQVILPDLEAAVSLLPASYPGAQAGRATSGAATALLGKAHLTRGDFVSAEARLQDVLGMGYSLLPDYNDVFDYSNPHHAEYIFDIEYQSGIGSGQGNTFTNAFMPNLGTMGALYGITGTLGEFNSPTQRLIDAFNDSPGDLRHEITIGPIGGYYHGISRYPLQDPSGEWRPLPQPTSQTYTLKFVAPVQQGSPANWKVIRYADVLLMLAEAMNENGKTAEAHAYINQVRARAGVAPYSNLTQAEFRDAIELERRLELAMEGHRWFDLVRWGLVHERLQHRGMQPYMTLYPVPQQQVDLINDPAIFPQNPGYN